MKLVIKHLGTKAEGVADGPEGPVFVPFALPGEAIAWRDGHALPEIITPSPARVPPVCPHFTTCGGCSLQHASDDFIAAHKTNVARQALARAGLEPGEIRFLPAHGKGRRRITIHIRKSGPRIEAGFMRARSHALVDIDQCPLLVPQLAQAFNAARSIGAALGGAFKPFDAQFTASQTGMDVDLRGLGPITDQTRVKLGPLVHELRLARLSIHGEVLAQAETPVITMGRARVVLVPGGFLQATEAAEAWLTEIAVDALRGARRIADLFCGIGPFALKLAEHAPVMAADSDAPAIQALSLAARATRGLKPVEAIRRDLFRLPFTARELAGFDAAVIDPPRAGAEAQMRLLAASGLSRIFSVGCNAQSFARDTAILIAAGWKMGPVTVIDQFRYSAHVELTALFTKD